MADGTIGPDNFTVPSGNSTFNGFGGVDTLTFNFKLTDATFTWVGNQVIIDTATSHTVVTGFEVFKFTDGTVNNADGSPLVDDLFYYAKNHDVWNVKFDPDAHYEQYGWREKRDPNAFFDTSLYLDANPGVSGINPLTHYAQTGWKIQLDTSFTFDTALYLYANPDVAAAGMNPLEHFLLYGASEGRQPFAANPFVADNGFDYAYYMANNPDVVAAGVDAFAHFQMFGWKEGRNPNAYFDVKGYLATYTDVAAAGVNPLEHYHIYGWREGRIPSPAFDTMAYLTAYPDVANAKIDPLQHYLKYGIQDGRSVFQSTLFDKQSAANSVVEGAAAGVQAGVTASWGGWVSPALTYSIINDTSGGAFAINTSTGVITVANGALLDFETVTSHSVTVQANDAGQLKTQVFVISVADAAPVIPPGAAPVVSVNELAANGTTFGLTFHVDDPNGPAAVYSLSGDAGGRFTINSSTGEIFVANGALIDYETSTSPGGSHTYQVTAVGTVGASSASKTFTININNINEAPQGTDKTATMAEDGVYTFSAADFGFSDPADSSAPNGFAGVVITTAPGAELTKNGVTVAPGDFITAAELAAGDLKFTPGPNGNGAAYASFSFRVRDNGGTANGGIDTDQSDNLMIIDVTAVNDAPTATPQSTTLALDEDDAPTALFTTPPTVADAEADALTATLTIVNTAAGVLTGGGFTPTGNPGEYAFSGTGGQLTTALAAVQFDSADNFSGSTNVAVAITDGANGPQGTNPSWTVAVTISAVNDAPTATPQTTTLSVDEDATAVALFATPPTVADVEGDALTATLTVVNTAAGVLTGGGFTPTGNPGEYAFSGTAAQLTTALAAVQFDSADNFNGSTNVTVAITDGANGPQGTNPSWTVAVTVNPVNDAPTATPQSTALTIDEDAAATALFTSPPTVADVDGSALTATLTLADPAAGVLTGGGFTPTGNPGEYAFSGTAAQLTTALAAVQFDSALNFSGPTSVAVAISDGSNGPQGINPSWTVDITVDEINDEPTVTATSNNPAYVPGADLFSAVTATTVEAGQLIDEIVLSVTNVTGSDEFLSIDGVSVALVDANSVSTTTAGVTVTVDFVGTTATITIQSPSGLTGTEVMTLIDGLAYTKTTVAPGEQPRAVTIVALHDTGGTANGGDDTGNPGLTSTVNFNIPPTIDVDATLPYTENQSAQVIDSSITITDTDDTHMEGAVVQITGNYAGAEDILAFNTALATGFGISGNVVGDTLTFTGHATKAEYEQVLESVTYRNSSDNPSTAARTVSFTVNDGDVNSATDTATITVAAQNDAPFAILSGVTSTYTEDGAPVAVDATLTVGDLDNANLVSALVQFASGTGQAGDKLEFTPQFGIVDSDVLDNQLTLTGTATLAEWQTVLRSITFSTTNQDPTTSRDISIQVNDGTTGSTPVIKTVTVTPVNDEPTLTATANGGGTVTFTESANVGGSSPVDLFSSPSASAVEAGQLLNDLVVTISNVTDTTEFLVAGTGATAVDLVNGNSESVSLTGGGTATATVSIVSGLATITFNSAGGMTAAQVNALVDSFQYDNTDDTPTAGSDVHTVTITSLSDNGSSTTPNDNTAVLNLSVDVNVVATNDAPVAADVTFKATGGTFGDGTAGIGNTAFVMNDPSDAAPDPAGPQKVVTGDLLALVSDVDSPQASITVVAETINNASGTLIIEADGDFTYLPAAGFTGDAQFTYTITDNDAINARTDTGTITITVDAPKVWYVDLNAANGGDGTSDNPFNSFASLNGAGGAGDVDGAGDIIFVYGNASHYTGGLQLEDGQQLIGQSVGLTVNGTALEGASGTNPFIDGGVVLAQNNTISGINFGDATTALSGTNFGTLTIGSSSISTNGGALSLNTGTVAGTGFTAVTSTGGTNSVSLTSVNGTVSLGGGALSGASGVGFNVSGGSASIDYNGSISHTGNARAISVINHNGTGGGGSTISFDGAVSSTSSSDGIFLDNNDGTNGTTISFSSALTINTSASNSAGFTATNGGTVTATGAGSTISSGAGTAVNVANTNIGSAGVTFQSVTTSGAVNGIVLNNTGTTAGTHGGLTVTGDGSASVNGSGGVIQNSTGTGIVLTNTRNVSLDQMNVTGSGDDGIHGNGVVNFTINRSNVNNNGNSTSDDGLQFGEGSGTIVGVTGTVQILSTSISGNAHNNVHFRNTSGTIDNLTVTNSTFNDLNDTTGANSFLFEASGTSTITEAFITGSTFSNNSPQRALEVQSHDTATISDFVVSGNTFNGNGIHASFTQDTSSNLEFYLVNNNITTPNTADNVLQAVNVFSSSQSTGGTIVGTISGNTIATNGENIRGIDVVIQGQTDATLLIDGNIITGSAGNRGIAVAFRGPTAPVGPVITNDVTITNNNVNMGGATPLASISVEADNQSGSFGTAPVVRADIRGNTVPATSAFDLLTGHIMFVEYDGDGTPGQATDGVGQLVDTAPASANANAQLSSTNTGSVASLGIDLIAGPINLPPSVPTPLMAAAGGVAGTSGAGGDNDLSAAELALTIQAAMARWHDAGVSDAQLAKLAGMQVHVADLGGSYLGLTLPGLIMIDDDAAGRGWFVDATPFDDAEFANALSATQLQTDPSGAPAGRMDLLTLVMHEIGHVLGLDHSHAPSGSDVMSAALPVGERWLPEADHAHSIMQGDGFDFSAVAASLPTSASSAALFDLLDSSTAGAEELLSHTLDGWVDVAQLVYGLHLGDGFAVQVREGWQV